MGKAAQAGIIGAAVILGLGAATAFGAEPAPPRLSMPVQCVIGTDCWISKYVDHDPSRDMRDYACGRLADDGHKGTDFAVRDMKAAEAGVMVKAAAAGTVLGMRDGMEDISIKLTGTSSVANRECGNGMVIAHGGDWQTQYCHLRKGSVRVKTGDTVEAGDTLGMLGLSGATEYPHVHFEVRHGKKIVDPFLGDGDASVCGVGAARLWTDEAVAAMAYRPVVLLNSGFATTPPEPVAARAGTYRTDTFPATAPTMVAWAEVLGLKAGDVVGFQVRLPDGKIREAKIKAEKSALQWLPTMPLARIGASWPAGRYYLEVSATRPSQGTTVTTRNEIVVP